MSKRTETMLREIDALPEAQQERILRVLEEEVRKVRREAEARKGRWAHLVERMREEAPMEGKSEEFLKKVREFRDHFDMRLKPTDK